MKAVERLIEGVTGQSAQVWVQERGGGPLRLRGEVVIEDLRPVLTSIASRSGANGPQNPVTQFMLQEAAARLADRLTGDHMLGGARGGSSDEVPRLLSSALGHQPFVESVMQMSQHQMLRRWPQATAWYTDVINYMLRSTRNDEVDQRLADSAPRWATASLGEFLREVAIHSTSANANDKERRVAEALRILWPDFPPVQNAFANTDRELKERWRPVCLATLETYDLELRPGVSPDTLVWAMDAMNSRQTLEAISGNGPTSERVAGTYWPSSAWATAILFSGACTDRAGNSLSPNEISERQPARTYTLATV